MGDEDLLEIIGNSKNIGRLQKHFKKMFAGVASILLNEDSTIVKGLSSKEGEEGTIKSNIHRDELAGAGSPKIAGCDLVAL